MGCFQTLAASNWPCFMKRQPNQQESATETTADAVYVPLTNPKITVTEKACGQVVSIIGFQHTVMHHESLTNCVNWSIQPSCPAVQGLQSLIETDEMVKKMFIQMFREIPGGPVFRHDPGGNPQVQNYHQMLLRFDDIVTHAPAFDSTVMAGFPINALLAWLMATPSGVAAFKNEKVNHHIRNILRTWAVFLNSPESTHVLSDDPERGWFGSKAFARMPNFVNDYVCDPTKPHYGFRSWNHFFTRSLCGGARNVAFPDDSSVIINACESIPYRLVHKVQSHDLFWMKNQPYSLEDMLAGDPLTPRFEGGTVYQAYLTPTSYHRWHSPVSGTITKAYRKAGAYYAQCPAIGFDESTQNSSQAYLTHVATRAIIFIECHDARIGLICFMPVGMAECSTCEINIQEGQRVEKGDELGMFHYGGSTYCLLFGPGVRLRFRQEAKEPGADSILLVNSALASPLSSVKGQPRILKPDRLEELHLYMSTSIMPVVHNAEHRQPNGWAEPGFSD